ncbi:hypothetical protein Q9189_005609, partial [Teloschistes chrysophthalmus]
MMIAQAIMICVGIVHAGHGIHVWNLHLDSVYAMLYVRELWITGGHCNNPAAWFIASGIFNVVSDFAILILPIPCIWKLQLPKKKKVMVSAVFATGILNTAGAFPRSSCADSLFRTYYSFRLDRDPDVTYNSIIDVIGAHLELCVGTVVSCAPVLPRFFQQHGHQITGLFRLPQVSGMIKRSKHFRLPSNTQQTQQRDPLEDPAQTSPPRVPNYHGALTKQKS